MIHWYLMHYEFLLLLYCAVDPIIVNARSYNS